MRDAVDNKFLYPTDSDLTETAILLVGCVRYYVIKEIFINIVNKHIKQTSQYFLLDSHGANLEV